MKHTWFIVLVVALAGRGIATAGDFPWRPRNAPPAPPAVEPVWRRPTSPSPVSPPQPVSLGRPVQPARPAEKPAPRPKVTISLVEAEEGVANPTTVDNLPLPEWTFSPPFEGPPTATARPPVALPPASPWDADVVHCVAVESKFEETPPAFWFQGEYLLWFLKDAKFPTLAATTSADESNVQSQFGGRVDLRARHGLRFAAGAWLDQTQALGVEASGFFLSERAVRFTATSDQDTSVVRPFVDVNGVASGGARGLDRFVNVGKPGVSAGRLAIDAPSSLFGVETNGRFRVWGDIDSRVDLLGGFRFLNLDESVSILDERTVLSDPEAALVGRTITVRDDFDTGNQFYGGQFGASARLRHGFWTLDVVGKLALGCTRQTVDAHGRTSLSTPLAGFPQPSAGLLTSGANAGRATRNQFAVVPEVGVTVGCQMTEAMRVWAGYNLLFWSNVVRPGDEINPAVDLQSVPLLAKRSMGQASSPTRPPVPRPGLRFNDTGFWAQGLNCGLELKY